MRRTLFRVTVGAMVAVLAVAIAGSALAQHGHTYGPRLGFQVFRAGGFGPGGPMGGGGMMFMGPGGFGMRGFGEMGPGGHGGPGGGGVLASDLLTPAASFLGFSSASALASELSSSGKTLAQEATLKGKTADGLIAAIVAAQKTNLDNEKAAGWITADQETAILARYQDGVTDLVNNGPPVPGEGKGGGLLQTASTYLGISVSDLQTALKSGKSLADVAKAQGKSVDGLVTALVAPVKKNLDQAVTDQKITQAQETTILNHITDGVTNLVNNVRPTPPQTSSSTTSFLKLAAFFTHR
jgi:hypothetical protein